MRVAIRADASPEIGSGHLTRCLTLADGLSARGAEVRFVCRTISGDLAQRIGDSGYPIDRLGAAQSRPDSRLFHAGWLGASQGEDAAQTVSVLSPWRPDWIVVDHYAIDQEWEREVRKVAGGLFVIDDLADRHHDCDLLLDQNLLPGREAEYRPLVPSACTLLLGPRYALLRPDYAEYARVRRPHSGEVRRVLVFLGGADLSGVTLKVLDALECVPGRPLEVDVVVGGANPRAEQIRTRCAASGWSVHEGLASLAPLLSKADLAIGAGGSAQWERCALGVPSLLLGLAENQKAVVAALADAGCVLGFVDAASCDAQLLGAAITTLIGSPALLRLFAERSSALVDGLGRARVLDRLLPLAIELRPAAASDAKALWAWRNAAPVRRFSGNPGVIPWEAHLAWLERTLKSPLHSLLIGESGGRPVGVLRYDFDADGAAAVVSIYRVPDLPAEWRGVGRGLLAAGERWLRTERPALREIRASVGAGNDASRRMFGEAGYRVSSFEFVKPLETGREHSH